LSKYEFKKNIKIININLILQEIHYNILIKISNLYKSLIDNKNNITIKFILNNDQREKIQYNLENLKT
jgi:hypothetical protein